MRRVSLLSASAPDVRVQYELGSKRDALLLVVPTSTGIRLYSTLPSTRRCGVHRVRQRT